jgi:hypothetical protein
MLRIYHYLTCDFIIGDDSFEYRDTGSRNLPQHILGHSALGGSMHVSATGGLGCENDVSFNGPTEALVYSQPHPSISASFEPLFQVMDAIIQQEDATQLTSGMKLSTNENRYDI